ncbi:hypothetical protein HYPSUDRAFT_131428 [Hypholoma sublateritium FD-334 SS-4]|uniref:Aminopeptidase n=1 Tax=Hypholoma sublateritium (strain FD-334 SS-4) TaxID=945553 RepID=A0A0D2P8U9_HYPSF|nr:hypothetical protein HYPSUDRAFT_131428 [Hypholoma sublateritium FD-334 SS-4]
MSTIEDPYRLPTNVKPTHYDITIKTDLEDLTFQGFVRVDLDIKADTTKIVLNTSDLDLGKATLYSDALKVEQDATFDSFDKGQERTTYLLANTLPAGSKAELRIGFSGKLTGSMTGYYRSSWEEDGKTKYYSLTQFEPTAARRAFPCWDEPLLKATFGITLISRDGTVNLSNMPAISEEPLEHDMNSSANIATIISPSQNEKWKISKFETTPPMSTYIVAFANGDFKFLEKSVVMPLSGKTIPLRIYTTADVIHQAQFALDVKAAVLPLYEKIFNVKYPLPKLDTLVVSDFDAGAMENWGLITGRLSVFLLDPERADQAAKKRVAAVQSHEVAHMWFGNITTMEWWNYLYLNEGFATLMGEVIIPDKVFPDWHVTSEFITDHLDRALALDAKLSSHPIEVECPDANHINQIFDALSYSKAASVLRMLSNYVGEEKFLQGVSLYLKKKLFANSVTHDLWEGISTATGANITQLMENWITKIGYPVLTVTETANGISVRQDRFLETGPAESKDNETIWNIPLSISSTKDGKANVDTTALLQEREMTIALDTSKPFKLNAGTTGVFRVLYTPERLTKIAAEAAKKNSAFGLDDRMGLAQDAFALSKAGFSKLSSALTLVDLWKNETEYLVWRVIANSLGELLSIWWENPVVVDRLNALRRSLFVPLVEKLGYEYSDKDSMDTSLLRTLAIDQASKAGDEARILTFSCRVIKELRGRFQQYPETGDDSKIPADLQRPTFYAAVKYGGREEFDAMIKIHNKPKTPSEKTAAILAMGATQDVALLEEMTRFITDKSRDQDIVYFFISLGANFKARRLLTKYLEDNYDVLYKRLEANFQLGSLVKYSTEYYSSEKDYAAIEAYFKGKDTSKYNQSLAQALDSVRARSAYVEVSAQRETGCAGLIIWLALDDGR